MTKFRIFILAGALLAAGSLSARPQCVELGWTGGAAGSGAKWVKGKLSERGSTIIIRYDWKNGVMTGQVQPDGTVKGTWIQDGSQGGAFQFEVPEEGEAMGWWTSAGSTKKNDMAIRVCE
ncbi:MAG: hypothetical protein JNM27_04860 [Leptospirales bacterium]|nr:hypothetical protein [Leptospirales bacterium]